MKRVGGRRGGWEKGSGEEGGRKEGSGEGGGVGGGGGWAVGEGGREEMLDVNIKPPQIKTT